MRKYDLWNTIFNNNDSTKPVATYFTSDNHSVSDIRTQVLGLIFTPNDSHKRQKMLLIHSLDSLHTFGISER